MGRKYFPDQQGVTRTHNSEVSMRLVSWLGMCLSACAVDYVVEKAPQPFANVEMSTPLLVTSNLAVFGAVSTDTNQPATIVISREGGAPNRQGLRAYGYLAAVKNGTLMLKEQTRIRFFRQENGSWVEDGPMIEAPSWRASAEVYGLAVSDKFLASGFSLYSWPERKYVTTLNPFPWPSSSVPASPFAIFAKGRFVLSMNSSLDYSGPRVFSYEYDGAHWTNGVAIAPPAGTTNFGGPIVSWREEEILIGDPTDKENGRNAGAVHVYRLVDGVWTAAQKLTPKYGMAGDFFGTGVVADNDRLYIGAPQRNEEQEQAGAIFVFEKGPDGVAWVERDKIVLRGAAPMARLAPLMAHDGIVYAKRGYDLIAFHRPVELNSFLRAGQVVGYVSPPDKGMLESTTDLSGTWQEDSSVLVGSEFAVNSNESARFFRVRMPSAF